MFPCLFHASFVYQVGFRFSLRIHISLVLKIFSQSTLAGGEGEFFFFFLLGPEPALSSHASHNLFQYLLSSYLTFRQY